jgi:hypothetical protein
LEDIFRPDLFGQIKGFLGTAGIHDHLAFTAPVAQINKDYTPHIPPAIDPTGQGYGLPYLLSP